MDVAAEWCLPTRLPRLEQTQVHVWRAALTVPTPRVENLQRLLSPAELDRAARFHFQKHREHFVVARGVLRALLGAYLDCAPHALQFRYNAYGKPLLAPPLDLKFNLSHSGEWALYALTHVGEVGVDLEHLRPVDDLEQIAARFFSAAESATLLALPQTQQTEAFFNCWTRKEAYIKGVGLGLSLPLDQFDVSLTPGEPARLLRRPDEMAEAWSLYSLQPAPDYVGALAAVGQTRTIDRFQWTPEVMPASR